MSITKISRFSTIPKDLEVPRCPNISCRIGAPCPTSLAPHKFIQGSWLNNAEGTEKCRHRAESSRMIDLLTLVIVLCPDTYKCHLCFKLKILRAYVCVWYCSTHHILLWGNPKMVLGKLASGHPDAKVSLSSWRTNFPTPKLLFFRGKHDHDPGKMEFFWGVYMGLLWF